MRCCLHRPSFPNRWPRFVDLPLGRRRCGQFWQIRPVREQFEIGTVLLSQLVLVRDGAGVLKGDGSFLAVASSVARWADYVSSTSRACCGEGRCLESGERPSERWGLLIGLASPARLFAVLPQVSMTQRRVWCPRR
jgi:hypothetical protein